VRHSSAYPPCSRVGGQRVRDVGPQTGHKHGPMQVSGDHLGPIPSQVDHPAATRWCGSQADNAGSIPVTRSLSGAGALVGTLAASRGRSTQTRGQTRDVTGATGPSEPRSLTWTVGRSRPVRSASSSTIDGREVSWPTKLKSVPSGSTCPRMRSPTFGGASPPRGGHPLHPREVTACGRFAADHDARLARLGHRIARRHRTAHRPDRARRTRRGRIRPRGALRARLPASRPSRPRSAADDRLRAPGFTRRTGGVDARPRHGQLLQDLRRLPRRPADGQPHPGQDRRQHHAVLVDGHWGLCGPGVLGGRTGPSPCGRPGSPGGLDAGRLHDVPGRGLPCPRSWVEAVYPKLTYFNEVDRGGHFAAWEEPELFSTEVRAAFKSVRN
jgi:hypothetical protein